MYCVIDIILSIQGPFITKSTAAGEYGVDAVLARHPDGRPYVAGTHIAGKLKQAWEEIGVPPDQAEKWLGRKEETAAATERKGLLIDDFVLEELGDRRDFRYRIRLDAFRGSVRKGAFQVIESPFGSGEVVRCRGEIRLLAADEAEAAAVEKWIRQGLRWIPALGAHRSIGFGRLLQANVRRLVSAAGPEQAVQASVEADAAWDLAIRPLAPFCIARRRVAKNLFESEDTIPGAVIKGALATTLRALRSSNGGGGGAPGNAALAALEANLEKLRISHAFPGRTCTVRPVVPPLSLVKVGKDELYDVASQDKPVVIRNREGKWEAPAFSIDWKRSEDVWDRCGWPRLARELRVRTSIDPGKRRSKEEQLFAYEMVVPGDTVWLARLDLSGVAATDRAQVLEALRGVLKDDFAPIGKTKARARVTLLPKGSVQVALPSQPDPVESRIWIVTLQTPALLCDLEGLTESTGEAELLEAYKVAWADISGNTLEVVRYFARQSLGGGEFFYHHFQKEDTGTPAPYKPYLLTDAGSVFVLMAKKEDQTAEARQKIAEWLVAGLPLPRWVKERYRRKGKDGDHWENCPYLPESGYGEIAVNLPLHRDLAPAAEDLMQVEA